MRGVLRVVVLVLAGTLVVHAQTSQAPPTSGSRDLPNAPSQQLPANSADERSALKEELSVDSPYQPLSHRQKFNLFLRHTVSPYTFASAGLNATWLQITGEPYSYGGGMAGWGRRFGMSLADTESRSFFSKFFFPTLLDQDPRYFPKRKGNIFERGWYAATRVLVTRSDRGSPGFNSSYMLGLVTSKALSASYIPEKRTFGAIMLGVVGSYGSDAGGFVLQEFTPDMLRLFRRHAPEKMKKIEKKIPSAVLGVPPETQDSTKPAPDSGRQQKCTPGEKCKSVTKANPEAQ